MALLMDAPLNGTINGTTSGPIGKSSGGLGEVPAVLSVTFTLTVAMIAVIVTRIYIRMNGGISSVRLVDWMHVLACLFSVAVSVAVVIGVRYGVGRHRHDIPIGDTITGLKFYWISKILYIVATWVVKMAVFTTLLIAASAPPQQGRKFLKTLLYGTMVFMTSYTVVFWIGAVIECRPVSLIFDKGQVRDGQCLPQYVIVGMANGHVVMNTATDLFFVLLPIFMVVYGVRRSMREKVAIGGVFVLAFFAVGAAGVHALYEFGYGETGEVLFDDSNLAIWAIVEINVGLIAINLPALSPLFRNILQPPRTPTRIPGSHSLPPATPTLSAVLAMTTVHQQQLERPESQRNIADPYPTPLRPAPPFAMQSTHRLSSDSKSNLSEIMAYQVDVDIEQHPAFREREKRVGRTATGRMGHRRMPTPMMF